MARVKLCDVIVRANTKVDKDNTELIHYVGGEHFESGNVTVENKGLIAGSTIGPMFYYGFKKGQFLLVSRNPHLRKAGVVDFDGICSEKTFVLESADPSVLLPEYLPFVLQNDKFWDYAIEHKHGSTNFFINWATLANYEIELPEVSTQKHIAELAWAAHKLKKSYLNQILATDELVKSQFIEMFDNGDFEQKTISELFTLQMGKTPERKELKYWDSNDYRWISIADLGSYGKYTADTSEYISQTAVEKSGIKIVPKNTVIMSFKLTIGRTAITSEDVYTNEAIMAFLPKTQLFNLDYLMYALRYKDWTDGMQIAVKGATLNKDIIGKASLFIPELPLQEKFAAFVEQSDKSKLFGVKHRIENFTGGYLCLMKQN